MSGSTTLSGLVASVLITLGVVSVINPAMLGYMVQCIVRLVNAAKVVKYFSQIDLNAPRMSVWGWVLATFLLDNTTERTQTFPSLAFQIWHPQCSLLLIEADRKIGRD
jgi:hypothetical protein